MTQSLRRLSPRQKYSIRNDTKHHLRWHAREDPWEEEGTLHIIRTFKESMTTKSSKNQNQDRGKKPMTKPRRCENRRHFSLLLTGTGLFQEFENTDRLDQGVASLVVNEGRDKTEGLDLEVLFRSLESVI